ncbi:unnamed protein product [Paramecium sonneborni]|uniref:LNS2/PITP domain-containing protein n=1 Tax=Paramecium sonneborni TaxID=65129 RepID=A0A8S1M6Z9_9CILI|nr:unnamed protein product [Paramecium sonneborni]
MKSIYNSIAKIGYKTKAAFSGVTDIVVVDQGNDNYSSTPFNVKFGKLKFQNEKQEILTEILHIREQSVIKQIKLIKIELEINGVQRDDIQFYLDDDQIGHFAYHEEEDIIELKQIYHNQNKQNQNQQKQQEIKLSNLSQYIVLSRVPINKTIISMKLNNGINRLIFNVNCKRLGLQQIECELYKIEQNQKIFISDIDGTITKSPTKGMIMSTFGKNYTQDYICQFYSKLVEKNYLILYMSARSMVQYEKTKEYLLRQFQDEIQLPFGPLILSPSKLFEAFTIEVIKKQTDILKSEMLNDLIYSIGITGTIQGGMGDKKNDIEAYKMVNINQNRILRINKKGELLRVNEENKQEQYTMKEFIQKIDEIF